MFNIKSYFNFIFFLLKSENNDSNHDTIITNYIYKSYF